MVYRLKSFAVGSSGWIEGLESEAKSLRRGRECDGILKGLEGAEERAEGLAF